jgi:CheY-like chemotaxis protein
VDLAAWGRTVGPVDQRSDLVGLVRVRPDCCLFTWREHQVPGFGRGPKTVEIHRGHCQDCIKELSRVLPDARLVDRGSSAADVTAPYRVLVVDDDPHIREELARALQEMGCEVDAAADGKQALARLTSDAPLPRLILLDLMMPGMDGEDFLDQQAADPRLADIPVVVITARHSPLRRAAVTVVHKPFRVETIGAIVVRHRS